VPVATETKQVSDGSENLERAGSEESDGFEDLTESLYVLHDAPADVRRSTVAAVEGSSDDGVAHLLTGAPIHVINNYFVTSGPATDDDLKLASQ